MLITRSRQQLVSTTLAAIAFMLSACASAAAPSVGSGEQLPEVTPPPPALATSLRPPGVALPPTISVSPDPTMDQRQDCGRVEMVATRLIDDAGNIRAVDCFWQAYQQCPTAAQLFVYQRFFETHNDRIFRLDGTSGQCMISEELRAYLSMANTPQTSTCACAGLTRDSSGLHFLGCGNDGDFTIPASPYAPAALTPSPSAVPMVRTVTLADEGRTINLPTGTV